VPFRSGAAVRVDLHLARAVAPTPRDGV
jgi:hypothetical protein